MFIANLNSYLPENPEDAPKLEYTDPLFRRRLSQISRMTVQVIHDLLEKNPDAKSSKIVFISFRGEIKREFSINEYLIEENDILPASFSLSVFNTPVALATLAFGMKGGYSVIYPSENNFSDALKTALSPILAETEDKIILVYADELVPEEYGELRPEDNCPLAFACEVSASASDNGKELQKDQLLNLGSDFKPKDFIKMFAN